MKKQQPAKFAPRISDAEWEVMRAVWNCHPATGNEIIERLSASSPAWHPKTVRTLLARLVRKKALHYKAEGRTYIYSPLVTEQEYVATVSDSFLGRVFGGSLRPMLVHFVEQEKLTKADLAELNKLLEKRSRDRTTKPGEKI